MLAETQTTEPDTAEIEAALVFTADGYSDADGVDHATIRLAERAVAAADQSLWRANLAEWERLKAEGKAHYVAGREDEGEDADRLTDAAFEEILNTRAPSLAAMADKGRLFINQALVAHSGPEASADNPAYLSHLMNDGWVEHALISLFQDAAALSGTAPPAIATARLEAFSARDWILSTAIATGARLSWVQTADAAPDHPSFEGPGASDAEAAFAALPVWHRERVEAYLRRQATVSAQRQADQADWVGPSCTAHMIRVFAEMAAWSAEPADGVKRAILRRRLRENMRRDIGLPVGLAGFDPEVFTADAYALGARFKMTSPLFGPELLKKNGDDRPETKALSEAFCALDGDQVEALGAYLQERSEWAQQWIAGLERDTGCVVSFYGTGIGFGIGPDHAGRLAEASVAYSALSDRERSDLRALAQSRVAGDESALDKVMAQ